MQLTNVSLLNLCTKFLYSPPSLYASQPNLRAFLLRMAFQYKCFCLAQEFIYASLRQHSVNTVISAATKPTATSASL